jgi:Bacteriophage minor capsid protein
MATEDDIRTFILSNVSAASGRTFCGLLREPSNTIPHLAVGVLGTGGLMPHGFMDNRGYDYRTVRLQVRVRSEVQDYQTGRDLAETLWQTLQRANLSTITSSYVMCHADQSAPVYIGRDDTEHHTWVVNLSIEKEE